MTSDARYRLSGAAMLMALNDPVEVTSNCQYLWIDLGHAAVSTEGVTVC
jgi:hypothetical protein